MIRWVVVGLALLFSLAAKAEDTFVEDGVTWQLFKSEPIELPLGESKSPYYQYDPALVSTWVRIDFLGAGCDAVATKLEVRPTISSSAVMVTPGEDGIFKTPGPTLYQYAVYARQTKYTKMLCTANLWLAKAPQTHEEPFSFLGTIQFTGGSFAITLPVSTTDRVTQVWVEKPSFCSNIEVRGIDTITNGTPYPAKVADKLKNIYDVEGGAGARITHVQVLLAGPASGQCTLGVYLKFAKE